MRKVDIAKVLRKRLILRGADELSTSCHPRTSNHHTIQDGCPRLGDISSQGTRVNTNLRLVLLHTHRASLPPLPHGGGVGGEAYFLRPPWHHSRETAPFHRAIRPVSRRPEVSRNHLALVRREREGISGFHLSFVERYAEADGLSLYGCLPYPMQRNKLFSSDAFGGSHQKHRHKTNFSNGLPFHLPCLRYD